MAEGARPTAGQRLCQSMRPPRPTAGRPARRPSTSQPRRRRRRPSRKCRPVLASRSSRRGALMTAARPPLAFRTCHSASLSRRWGAAARRKQIAGQSQAQGRALSPGRPAQVRPGQPRRPAPDPRRLAVRHPGLGPVRRAQARAQATTHSARRRPAWARLAAARGPASQARPARAAAQATLVLRLEARPEVAQALRVRPAAPGHPDRARWAAGQGREAPVTPVVQVARVLVVRVRAQAACRRGPSPLVAVLAAGQAGRESAPGRAAAAARVLVAAAVQAVAAARARRALARARLARALAVAAGAARRARSGVPAAGPHAGGSRRSSGVKSSTTCRRRRSAACRYRVAMARRSGSRAALR